MTREHAENIARAHAEEFGETVYVIKISPLDRYKVSTRCAPADLVVATFEPN